jgi:NAD(P)H-dependent flavin oxidoreductase YrpB (nitropropane dioxygenase family)
MKTRITELFGIRHPIIQGGMHFVGLAEMAAAVSNAGGLGIITGLTQRTPADLAKEIARCREMTDQPFAVNLTFLPSINPPDYPGYIQAIIDGGVKIVETAGNNPQRFMPALKENGIKVIHKCTSVRHSLKAETVGCDAISVDGFECGGHPGEDDVPNFILLNRAAEALTVPFVASGGMANGRSLAAALALGADGINMGTRFCATQEAPIHPNVKQAYIDNDERGTNLIFRSLKNTARVGKSDVSDEVVRRLAVPGARFSDVAELVSGAKGRILLEEGDMSAGVFWASMAQGLIHDIPTVKVLIDRIMAEAESVIGQRLAGMLKAS